MKATHEALNWMACILTLILVIDMSLAMYAYNHEHDVFSYLVWGLVISILLAVSCLGWIRHMSVHKA
jgi:hypothetical protein